MSIKSFYFRWNQVPICDKRHNWGEEAAGRTRWEQVLVGHDARQLRLGQL